MQGNETQGPRRPSREEVRRIRREFEMEDLRKEFYDRVLETFIQQVRRDGTVPGRRIA